MLAVTLSLISRPFRDSTETKLFLRESMLSVAVQKSQLVESIGLWFFCPTVKLNVHFTDIRSKKRECELRVNQGNRGFSVKGMKEGLSLRSVCETVLSVCQRERCWTHHDAGSSCRVPKTDQVQKNHFIFFSSLYWVSLRNFVVVLLGL